MTFSLVLLVLGGCGAPSQGLPVGTKGVTGIADWTYIGATSGARVGNSVRGVGDVNGDGVADLGVASPAWSNPETHEGRVLVFTGAVGGMGSAPTFTAESDVENQNWGTPISEGGDVDGDGVADLVWGGNSIDDDTSAGTITVQLGNADFTGARWSATTDTLLVNGFGWASRGIGDVNGDGYADVACGAPIPGSAPTAGGNVFVWLGSADGPGASPSWSASTVEIEDLFGYALAGMDVNRDGFSDLVVGAPRADTTEEDTGTVSVFLGSGTGLAATAAWTWSGAGVGYRAGQWLAPAGDVNGDGHDDLLVGGGQDADPLYGHAWLFLGSAVGLDATPAWEVQGFDVGTDFGVVAGGGDLNLDGYDDIAVGAPATPVNGAEEAGAVYVYYGSASGPATTPDLTIPGDRERANFGQTIDFVGDVNGDGGEDLAVGAPVYIDTVNGGAVFVYYGVAPSDTGDSGPDDSGDDSATTDSSTTPTPDSGDDSGDVVGPIEDTGGKGRDGCGCGTTSGGGVAGLALVLAAVAASRRR